MKKLIGLTTLGFASLLVGCDTASTNVDVVDLNKVLDALVVVLDKSDAAGKEAPAASAAVEGGDAKTEGQIAAIPPEKQDPEKVKEFLTAYAAKLNEVKAMNATVGVAMGGDGEIIGFKDPNTNNVQDAGETTEFKVTIDAEQSRLVASDNNGHYRPHGYRPGNFFTGYLIGSMLGRQNSFYSGATAATRPSFRDKPMSAPDYHKSAVSSARSSAKAAASSSARMRTGSKGFSFGK